MVALVNKVDNFKLEVPDGGKPKLRGADSLFRGPGRASAADGKLAVPINPSGVSTHGTLRLRRTTLARSTTLFSCSHICSRISSATQRGTRESTRVISEEPGCVRSVVTTTTLHGRRHRILEVREVGTRSGSNSARPKRRIFVATTCQGGLRSVHTGNVSPRGVGERQKRSRSERAEVKSGSLIQFCRGVTHDQISQTGSPRSEGNRNGMWVGRVVRTEGNSERCTPIGLTGVRNT